jgi:cell division protein FtsL
MSPDCGPFWVTSLLQTTLLAAAIFMLYQQSRMLHEMHGMVLGANQLAAASVRMDDLVKEVRELLRKKD